MYEQPGHVTFALQIHISLINGRPSAERPSPTLLTHTSARFVRLRLQRILTLYGDLMTINSNSGDSLVTRRVSMRPSFDLLLSIGKIDKLHRVSFEVEWREGHRGRNAALSGVKSFSKRRQSLPTAAATWTMKDEPAKLLRFIRMIRHH